MARLSFERRHYIALGNAIHTALALNPAAHTAALTALVTQLCALFKLDNPRFSAAKFKRVCGLNLSEQTPQTAATGKTGLGLKGNAWYDKLDDGTPVLIDPDDPSQWK